MTAPDRIQVIKDAKDALRKALDGGWAVRNGHAWSRYHHALQAAYEGGDLLPSNPARKHAGELVEALISVTASLVAATSLLDAGGKSAAPSDKMYSIMLDDYKKSADSARAILAKLDEKGANS